jgi:branched-chain amino acid aminotransferase
MQKTDYIWFNGELVDWDKATVHVLTHALHYGSSIFEGIRCYDTPRGSALFRLTPHFQRMFDSAKIYRMEMPYTLEQLVSATKQVITANKLRSAYVRPLAFRGYGTIGLDPRNSPMQMTIVAIEWGSYLGAESLENGVDVCVSSWNRFAPNTMPAMAKAGGNYLNSILVKTEAVHNGYSEGIVLDANGFVSEGSGENLFVVRDGVVTTPPFHSSILGGITRDSVMLLLREKGVELRQQVIPREMLYLADEVFFTGTAAEIVPVRSIDGITVGSGTRGPLTAAVQEAFFSIVRGERDDTYGWMEYIDSEH